jgi:2-dehydropantoate 2-reductase
MTFLAPLALLTTRYALPLGDVRTRHREELTALLEETAAVSRSYGGPVGRGGRTRALRHVPSADEVVDAA